MFTRTVRGCMVVLTALTLSLSSCAPRPTAVAPLPSATVVPPTKTPHPSSTPTLAPTRTPMPTATLIPLPSLTLKPGDSYFSLNGSPAFLFSRNPAGWVPEDWATIVRLAHQQSDHFVRLATNSASMGGYHGYGYTPKGEILKDWSDNWEEL